MKINADKTLDAQELREMAEDIVRCEHEMYQEKMRERWSLIMAEMAEDMVLAAKHTRGTT